MRGEFFHILNRGIEDKKIFLKKENYLRFVNNMDDFNNKENATLPYFFRRKQFKLTKITSQTSLSKLGKKLVDIFCWTLIPNHYHIFVQEKIDGGASEFTRKIGIGYTMHFNEEEKRSGVLFKGRSKIIPVKEDAHFIHLPFYILANPLDLFQPGWREKGITNPKKAFKFLENYQWSAFQDLLGKSNFPEVINKKLLYELFDTNERKFKKDFIEWLNSCANSPDLENFDEYK
ncbi:MAG: hypothetical protein A3H02_00545 [Candidatus Niyogibacteria bacterium RIFCSPLOWO2_12_FULL_41_13]|uniref:Transposase IS200-like domain-containing protein n=1 Tax=Candidatus Niyogibacteria bacterium RIFCSPLOWO2_12_FULL_41_13 TaxID=1801726 RepID=A0A1G2F3Q5_9BACT|nr:MAG: hypothetical protein A3H02_00545 [Candidatus Niyogibacteria bacterium RIFCSPLOWO2_12_FULL_41_13]